MLSSLSLFQAPCRPQPWKHALVHPSHLLFLFRYIARHRVIKFIPERLAALPYPNAGSMWLLITAKPRSSLLVKWWKNAPVVTYAPVGTSSNFVSWYPFNAKCGTTSPTILLFVASALACFSSRIFYSNKEPSDYSVIKNPKRKFVKKTSPLRRVPPE